MLRLSVAAAAMAVLATPQVANVQSVASTLPASVMLLYSQANDGSMDFRCTATAFESPNPNIKPRAGRRFFLSASHCVTERTEHGTRPSKGPFFLSDDVAGEKRFVEAELIFAGSEADGYDLLILEAKSSAPALHLADERSYSAGTQVLNVASPAGLGKTLLSGTIAILSVDRPLIVRQENINWRGSLVLNLAVIGGSSGSAVVTQDSGRIIGVIVGYMEGAPICIAVPASRLLEIIEKAPIRRG
jgi:S1-C subfamily serine protease